MTDDGSVASTEAIISDKSIAVEIGQVKVDPDIAFNDRVEKGWDPQPADLDFVIKYGALTYERMPKKPIVGSLGQPQIDFFRACHEAAQIPDRKLARKSYCDFMIRTLEESLTFNATDLEEVKGPIRTRIQAWKTYAEWLQRR